MKTIFRTVPLMAALACCVGLTTPAFAQGFFGQGITTGGCTTGQCPPANPSGINMEPYFGSTNAPLAGGGTSAASPYYTGETASPSPWGQTNQPFANDTPVSNMITERFRNRNSNGGMPGRSRDRNRSTMPNAIGQIDPQDLQMLRDRLRGSSLDQLSPEELRAAAELYYFQQTGKRLDLNTLRSPSGQGTPQNGSFQGEAAQRFRMMLSNQERPFVNPVAPNNGGYRLQ